MSILFILALFLIFLLAPHGAAAGEELPCRNCATMRDLYVYLCDMRKERVSTFNVNMSRLLTNQINTDSFHNVVARAGVSDHRFSYYQSSGLGMFTQVKWTDDDANICTTESQMLTALSSMRKHNRADFKLVLTASLFQQVSDNSFARLHQLEGKAMMISHKMSYNNASKALIYSEVRFASSDSQLITTSRQLVSVLEAQLALLPEEVPLFLSREMYDLLMKKYPYTNATSVPGLTIALKNAGVAHYQYISSAESCSIRVVDIEYRNGFRIARSIALGRTDKLSARDREVLAEAQAIAREAARKPSLLDRAAYISQAIDDRCVYDTTYKKPDIYSLYGCLLNGEAVCSGYGDAYYLIAFLLGIPVRYQVGRDLSPDRDDDESHLWNLILVDGTWRLVDSTWNDSELPHLMYFNIGEDRARCMYRWNPTFTVPLLKQTIASERPKDEFMVGSQAALSAAVSQAIKRRMPHFHIFPVSGMELDTKLLQRLLDQFSFYGSCFLTTHGRYHCYTIQLKWNN